MLSFIFKGIKGTGKKTGNILQPPSFINLVFTHNPKSGLQYAREYSSAGFYHNLLIDPYKSAVALFCCELIYRSVTESEAHPELFNLFHSSFWSLDEEAGSVADFPLTFMTQLSRFHGFYPLGAYTLSTRFFDLQSGRFCSAMPDHVDFLDPQLSSMLSSYLERDPSTQSGGFSSGQRYALLMRLIEYYRLHLPGFSGLKSPAVLRELFG